MIVRLLARRLLLLIPILFAVVTIVFLFLRAIPGDPVEAMLGEGAKTADLQALRRDLMLDRPLREQYVRYITGIFSGDLGQSWSLKSPVAPLLLKRLPATLELALCAFAFACLTALPLGVLAARHNGTWIDRLTTVFAVTGGALPSFWLGPLLVLVFSIGLGWLPVSGRGTFANLILPSISLGVGLTAVLVRMLRSSLLEEFASDYVRTARAKGLGERRVVYRHALRNAFLPVLTILGLQLGGLLTGAIITETIFSWPGIGRLLIQAIFSRDYPLVQGCVLIFAFLYSAVNLLVDLLYLALDPRIRLGS